MQMTNQFSICYKWDTFLCLYSFDSNHVDLDVSQSNLQKSGGRSDWRWSQRRLHVKLSDAHEHAEETELLTEWGKLYLVQRAKAKRGGGGGRRKKRKRSSIN